jgi:nitroimidazol reductase NimA-like FMN-containing flavoprotein (pyridoxamine 5'-phosphate oxidase superfamily)
MEKQEHVRREISRILAGQLLAVLATQQAGQPYASLLAFATSDDLAHLFLATARDTSKFRNILADNRVALLIDDRSNQSADFETATALTVIGTAAETAGLEKEEARTLYLARHPSLSEFIGASGTALLKIAVSRYVLVTRFQEVLVLDITG